MAQQTLQRKNPAVGGKAPIHDSGGTRKQVATLKYLHISPRKVRLVADSLKGLRINEAEAQLMLRPHRSAGPLLKLLRSAAANAKHNQKIDPEKLAIAIVKVDQGPMLKRFLPRAMGRATPIQKKMSHVTIVLEERDAAPNRFTIIPPPKKDAKAKKAAKPKALKAKKSVEQTEKPKEKSGFFRKMFRRKSV